MGDAKQLINGCSVWKNAQGSAQISCYLAWPFGSLLCFVGLLVLARFSHNGHFSPMHQVDTLYKKSGLCHTVVFVS
jgi:hypothetical protein